jgi:hypothetical protein
VRETRTKAPLSRQFWCLPSAGATASVFELWPEIPAEHPDPVQGELSSVTGTLLFCWWCDRQMFNGCAEVCPPRHLFLVLLSLWFSYVQPRSLRYDDTVQGDISGCHGCEYGMLNRVAWWILTDVSEVQHPRLGFSRRWKRRRWSSGS